ncbi:hypothetical protein KUCAC02_035627, partial [Chaenocephalus aceratus]
VWKWFGGPLEVRIKAEQEALAESRQSTESRFFQIQSLVPVKPSTTSIGPPPGSGGIEDGELHPKISKSLMECRQNGVSTGEDESSSQQLISSNETRCGDAVKSFHPLARWYQTSDSLIVTMKLKEPQNQSCHFFQDRVVYSGRVNERTYRADLQLHANIAPDRCCWEMKSNEPVLKLFKQQPGHWEKLLRNKNIFENMGGNNNCYVVSESGSESD